MGHRLYKPKVGPRDHLIPLHGEKFEKAITKRYGRVPDRVTIWKWRKKGIPAYVNGPCVIFPTKVIGRRVFTSAGAIDKWWNTVRRLRGNELY